MRFILGLILAPAVALGHAGDLLESLDVKPPGSGDFSVAIESTVGLLWAENGSDYRWVCHESVTRPDALMTPRYVRSPSGFTLVTVPKEGEGREGDEVVYRSTDHCDWQPVSGLTGQVIVDFSLDPSTPETVFAIANNPDDTTGNGVRVSTDGGLSWSNTGLADTERQFASILARGGDVWATSVDFSAQLAWIYRSQDSGSSWQEWNLDFTEYASPPDLQLLEVHDNGVWLRTTQTLNDDLWTLELDEDQARRVYVGDTKIMSAVQLNGQLYTALWNQGIARYAEGAMNLIPDSPVSYAIRSDGQILYAATRPLFTSQGLMTSADGVLFEGAFTYSALGPPPTCDAGSHSALYCEPLWEALSDRLAEAPTDTGDTGDTDEWEQPADTDPPEVAKGCKKSRSGQAGILFVIPLVYRRRGRFRPAGSA
jgi:hypothetical protein